MLQPLMPADLGHASFGRKISFQDDEPPGLLQRPLQRRNYFLPGSFDGTLALGPRERPVTVFAPG